MEVYLLIFHFRLKLDSLKTITNNQTTPIKQSHALLCYRSSIFSNKVLFINQTTPIKQTHALLCGCYSSSIFGNKLYR